VTSQQARSIAAIVVNWGRRDLLRACLRSLQLQTHSNVRILVVDNGSNDGSVEMVREEFGELVTVLANAENRGFCAAVNQAIRASDSEYVALLNNDAEADPRWLEEMAAAIERADDVGMCASKILLHDDRRVIDKAGHLLYPDGQNRGRGTGELDVGQYEREEETLFPDGCAALYRRALFDSVGLFDEDFFAYADDAELGLRAQLGGWRAIYCPRAIVYHHHSSALGAYSTQKVFYVERNRIWLAVKLFPVWLLLLNPYYAFLRIAWEPRPPSADRAPAAASPPGIPSRSWHGPFSAPTQQRWPDCRGCGVSGTTCGRYGRSPTLDSTCC